MEGLAHDGKKVGLDPESHEKVGAERDMMNKMTIMKD